MLNRCRNQAAAISRVSRILVLVALGCGACGGSTDSTGAIFLYQGYADNLGGPLWVAATASFSRDSWAKPCTMVARDGNCQLETCPINTDTGPVSGPNSVPVGIDAGAVTARAKQLVSLVYGSDGNYLASTSSGLANPQFDPGQTIVVDVAGKQGDPPACHLAFSAPGRVSPSSPHGVSTVLDRSQDFAFTWTATLGNVVGAYIEGGNRTRVGCEWPMADGQGLVPSSMLSGLPAGTVSGSIWAESITAQDRTRWHIVAGALVIEHLEFTLL